MSSHSAINAQTTSPWWEFQSIDTMKYSRDTSREFLGKMSEVSPLIDRQVSDIAQTGATHVAIATPYDEEFLPILKMWVTSARKHNLKIWFRGNWSGWERWFDYPSISRSEHIEKTSNFIIQHPELFEDGDIFSGCPECENGGPGDPRLTGDIVGHREFLINEYKQTKKAFDQINKSVASNYFSMNGDVARAVMDVKTTQQLDGIITIDHYVATPEKLAQDISEIAKQSKGRVVLGEFGAPIPDIHGNMTQEQQAKWLDQALSKLVEIPELIGVSYWTNVGGSTQLWSSDGSPRQAVGILRSYFIPKTLSGKIINDQKKPIANVLIEVGERRAISDQRGNFTIAYLADAQEVVFSSTDYLSYTKQITAYTPQSVTIVMEPDSSKTLNLWQRLINFFRKLLHF